MQCRQPWNQSIMEEILVLHHVTILMTHADHPVKARHGEAAVALVLPFTVLGSSDLLEGGRDDKICRVYRSFTNISHNDLPPAASEVPSSIYIQEEVWTWDCLTSSVHGNQISCELTGEIVVFHVFPAGKRPFPLKPEGDHYQQKGSAKCVGDQCAMWQAMVARMPQRCEVVDL